MKVIRRVQFEDPQRIPNFSAWQAGYLDDATGKLIPNTEIWERDKLILRINSFGCKGEEPNPDSPAIAFFGDSTVFGVSFTNDSWPARVNITGCQTLNAGVEGYPLERMVSKYRELREEVNLAGIVVVPGWHNMFYGERSDRYWEEMLLQFSGDHFIVISSIATPLTEECKVRGLDGLITTGDGWRQWVSNLQSCFEYNLESLSTDYFSFWCQFEPSANNIRDVIDGVKHYNSLVKSVCEKYKWHFLDLYSYLVPASYEEITKEFFDVAHLRPSAYAKVGEYVSTQLGAPLSAYYATKKMPPLLKQLPTKSKKPAKEDLRKSIYPLW